MKDLRGYMVLVLCCMAMGLWAHDTVYVSGGIQHDGLFPTQPVSSYRTTPRAPWAKIDHLSNNYIDLSVHYLRMDSAGAGHLRGIQADTRIELNQWPLLGYEPGFAGHGIGRLSLKADFDWGSISVGDVYGQFGSGMLLNLYENRDLGIDNYLRGAKLDVMPYKGIRLTAIGGKQRRYWNCYEDRAWGWNYAQDAAMGVNMELGIHDFVPAMHQEGIHLSVGGSYVSKYEHDDTLLVYQPDGWYRYNLPRWVGAGEVRASLQAKGWDALVEYAYKANDPTAENSMSYRPGQALLLSLSYSRKGLAVLAQAKHSDNMSFRSSRNQRGLAGRLNLLPVFTPQHTYSLAAIYPYATQYATGEWAFQAELRYTWGKKTKMGGKYGTTVKLSAAHVRGLRSEGSWAVDMSVGGEYYTDVNVEFNKRVTRNWWTTAMLLYQAYNQQVIVGKGGMVRAGTAVWENKVKITDQFTLRNELQYLFTRQDAGQWLSLLLELDLWQCLTISGEYSYNAGNGSKHPSGHYYTVAAAYTHDAHRLSIGYTKNNDGYNCAGGVCRYMPEQEGVTISYSFNW